MSLLSGKRSASPIEPVIANKLSKFDFTVGGSCRSGSLLVKKSKENEVLVEKLRRSPDLCASNKLMHTNTNTTVNYEHGKPVLIECDDEVSSSSEVVVSKKSSLTPIRSLDAFVFRRDKSDLEVEEPVSTTTSSLKLLNSNSDIHICSDNEGTECDFDQISSLTSVISPSAASIDQIATSVIDKSEVDSKKNAPITPRRPNPSRKGPPSSALEKTPKVRKPVVKFDPAKEERKRVMEEERQKKLVELENKRLARVKLEEDRKRAKEDKLKELEQRRIEREKEAEQRRIRKEEEAAKRAEEKIRQEDERKAKLKEVEDKRKEKEQAKEAERLEKERIEREKTEEVRKQQMLFRSFFSKPVPSKTFETNMDIQSTASDSSNNSTEVIVSRFKQFQPKKGMTLAPHCRRDCLNDVDKNLFDDLVFGSINPKVELYLDNLRSSSHQPAKRYRSIEPDDDVIPICDPFVIGNVEIKMPVKVKYLLFRENHRPSYYGTHGIKWKVWPDETKPKLICGRRPFAKDEVAVVSMFKNPMTAVVEVLYFDDEWEDDPAGEECRSDDEDDDEPTENSDGEEDDGFLVPHGYLSDDEIDSDTEEDPEVRREKIKVRDHVWRQQHECQKTVKPLPYIVGPIWPPEKQVIESKISTNMLDRLKSFEAMCMFDQVVPTSYQPESLIMFGPGEKRSQNGEGSRTNSDNQSNIDRKKVVYVPIPDEAIPDLIQIVHCCPFTSRRMQIEFLHHWSGDGRKNGATIESVLKSPGVEDVRRSISRPQLKAKIIELAEYSQSNRRWSLRENFAKLDLEKDTWIIQDPTWREKHKLDTLPNEHQWTWATVREATTPTPKNSKSPTPALAMDAQLEKTPIHEAIVASHHVSHGKKLNMSSGGKSSTLAVNKPHNPISPQCVDID